jgi:hypothetical protein
MPNLKLFCSITAAIVVGAGTAVRAQTDAGAPQLVRHGTATQLVVDGKPFLCLAGELNNSSSSSIPYMKTVWPRLTRMHLNTVIAAVSWELTEPQEGVYDFSLVDGLIRDARANNVHLVFLWFGSWKNGLSSYQPLWVKTDTARFPLAQNAAGEPQDILSTLGDNTCRADAHAYAALMGHIRQIDGRAHTVLAMQVENEVGMRGDSRDRSPAANAAFASAVPTELMRYLTDHADALVPELREQWVAAGRKTSGTWTEVFGDSLATDEIFMAWNYARYVGRVAAAGKAQYPIPMYANCWLDQPGTPKPGDYPSGGPLAHLLDIWHAGAPAIDLIAPDLYVGEFAERADKFTRAGNPLFIAETNTGDRAGINALYSFGAKDAICFSPFGIDGFLRGSPVASDPNVPDTSPLAQAYLALGQMAPLIAAHQGTGTMAGVMLGHGALDENATQQVVKLGDYTITVTRGRRRFFGPPPGALPPGASAPTAPDPLETVGGVIVQVAPDQFVLVSAGLNFAFANAAKPGRTLVASVDEGTFVNGQWIRGRRLNGDQDDHDRDPNRALYPYRIMKVTLYQRP